MRSAHNITTHDAGFKSGYVSLIGKPNVGKSTLLNRLVREKLAAMSRRPQTTRNRITGVCHLEGGQIILMDTPGIHQGARKLNEEMVKTSLSTCGDVDLILFMVDARQGFGEDDAFVLESLKQSRTPKILVINKIDLIPKARILELTSEINARGTFVETVPISALKEDGLDLLERVILKRLPEGPRYFPEDMVTDAPEEFLIMEIIREKVFKLTAMEIPYSVAVVVDGLREGKRGMLVIDATIFVEKASQKKIVIGGGGKLLKKIGTWSREEIERRFGNKVFLNLYVKVKERWRDNVRDLKEFGYKHGFH
ncbi:GTPase Era [Nitrospina gracilis]|uniref:GTPase Era n=1 Tax=Nitrospina gracilis TaxID=35801 RepID=UPI00235133AA|nr:GTPase Era [Nitrospina gracilis]